MSRRSSTTEPGWRSARLHPRERVVAVSQFREIREDIHHEDYRRRARTLISRCRAIAGVGARRTWSRTRIRASSQLRPSRSLQLRLSSPARALRLALIYLEGVGGTFPPNVCNIGQHRLRSSDETTAAYLYYPAPRWACAGDCAGRSFGAGGPDIRAAGIARG